MDVTSTPVLVLSTSLVAAGTVGILAAHVRVRRRVDDWARVENLTLLECRPARRYESPHAFRIRVRDDAGAERSGWVDLDAPLVLWSRSPLKIRWDS